MRLRADASSLATGRRVVPIVIAAVLTMSGLAACGGSEPADGAAKEPAATAELTGAQLIDKVRGGTVAVVSQPPGETKPPKSGGAHSHGSGIIYDARRGLVLTSNHLIEGAGSIKVRVNEKTEVQGRAVARAQCDDIALLALNPKPAGLVAVPFADIEQVREGERVTALGYLLPPDGRQRLLTAGGDVSAIDVPGSIHPDLPNLPSLVLHQAPLQPTSTGGPLVNARGELVGLNTVVGDAGSGPFNAVSVRRLEELLAKLEEGSGSRFKGWGAEHGECHGAMAEIAQSTLVSHGGDPSPGRRGGLGGVGGGHGAGHGG